MNHWIITKDHIDSKLVGIKSRSFPADLKPENMPVRFKMYDDDRQLYCEGRMMECDFDPLDDFGMGGLGCTELQYSKNGKPFDWM